MTRIYSDGAASPNPGKAGYGTIVESKEIVVKKEGFRLSTNNRMELLGVIVGLETTNDSEIAVYSDSRYVTDSVSKGWVFNWERNDWRKKDKDVPNKDLWMRLLGLIRNRDVSFNWIRGHDGHEQNEKCDEMAVEMRKEAKGIDIEYEKLNQ